ncbi:MAG: hypothetical protein ACI910_002518, partial [Oleispira sp.]
QRKLNQNNILSSYSEVISKALLNKKNTSFKLSLSRLCILKTSAGVSSDYFQEISKKPIKNNTLSQLNSNHPKVILSEQAANNTLIHGPVNRFLQISYKTLI